EISIDECLFNDVLAYDGMLQFNPLQQMLATIPLRSINILPNELRIFYDNNSILRDMYYNNFITELEYKERDEESVPIIPIIDRNRIYDAYQLYFKSDRAMSWNPQQAQTFKFQINQENLDTEIYAKSPAMEKYLKSSYLEYNQSRKSFNTQSQRYSRGDRRSSRGDSRSSRGDSRSSRGDSRSSRGDSRSSRGDSRSSRGDSRSSRGDSRSSRGDS